MRDDNVEKGRLEREYIKSDTFTPTGKRLGMGCWGVVDAYTDMSGQEWAIKRFAPNETAKEQMKTRGWTEEDVMRREAIPLDAAHHHLVPRLIERDKNGKMYVAMPVYTEQDLAEKIWNRGYLSYVDEKLRLPNGDRFRKIITIATDVADALAYLHSKTEEVQENRQKTYKSKSHGDVKPSNVFMKKDRAYLSDLGSKTCISIGNDGGSVRGQFGDINYRAPEAFTDNASPTPRTDVFSLGSMIYHMITGERIYDGENNLWERDGSEFNRIVRRKLRKVPRSIRGTLRHCLAYNTLDRYLSAREVLSDLEQLTQSLNDRSKLKRAAVIAAAIPFALLIGHKIQTYEPKIVKLPDSRLHGPIELVNPEQDYVKFSREENLDLEEVSGNIRFSEEAIKLSTDNRNVAAVMKAYIMAQTHLGGLRQSLYNDHQFIIWRAYSSRAAQVGMGASGGRSGNFAYEVIAQSIEVGLEKALKSDGSVDLEDAMVISRFGEDVLRRAMQSSGSFDFKNYITAVDSQGNRIISEREARFLRMWRAYAEKLFD